ncbi:hypothetical protein KTO58_07980 [Chitinophaga pendula]|uniref:hypothetical protein n=1 Tax=Chitinophaga TaxID=79328 RepID=UPI000BB0AB27|nr:MULTISPECIES: hypothetical protein [Chitinophaga]ASZ13268.1 hypothetical protein CK934_21035 [Chitinophaga sp. MD30]UCJ09109.1 hypothetical protein KTO58_07980 [Chitinophaga pendula]
MNIEQAKRVPLRVILNILGLKATQPKNAEESDVITYVCRYLENRGESSTEADAVRWITIMSRLAPEIRPVVEPIPVTLQEKSLFVDGIKPISNPILIHHLENQGIPLSVAKSYMKEIRICQRGTKETFFALGFRNEVGGWSYSNPFRKGFIGKRYITFIRGTQVKPDGIHIFKDDADFMAALIRLENGRMFKDDAIVLNCMANLPRPTPYIKGYGYRVAHTWMDNCETGKDATQSLNNFFKTEDRLLHMPMNRVYAPYLGVSAWHMKELGFFDPR